MPNQYLRADRKESQRAMEAYHEYLGLPAPRDYKVLIGKCPRGKGNTKGKPYTYNTLRDWAHIFKWRDRAAEHDAKVQERREANLLKYKLDEQDRRVRQRLQAAEVQRTQALQYLIDENTHMPKPLQRLDARLAEIAGQYIKQAGDAERLDLADVVRKEDDNKMTINVLTADGLKQLREVVQSIKIETNHQLPDIIDAEVLHDDDSPSRGRTESDVTQTS